MCSFISHRYGLFLLVFLTGVLCSSHPVVAENTDLFQLPVPEILFESPVLEIFSSVTVAELDGDPEPEYLFGTDRTGSNDTGCGVYAINPDGSPVAGQWPFLLNIDVRSSPAAADLDGDGRDEVIIGSYAPAAGIRILSHTGIQIGFFPTLRSIIASPAVADLDGQPGLEIVAGTGDGTLLVLKNDGTLFSAAWPVLLPRRNPPILARNDVDASPAIGDINGDTIPEIIVTSDDGLLYVYAISGQPLPGFPYETPAETYAPDYSSASNFSSPIIADVDGDGIRDVIACFSNGRIYALRGNGSLIPGFPVRLPLNEPANTPARSGDDFLSTPAVGDLDLDGLLELVVVFHDGPASVSKLYIFDLRSPAREIPLGWPTFQANTLRTGLQRLKGLGDCDGDGEIGSIDFTCFLLKWVKGELMPGFDPMFDVDGDGRINAQDLTLLLMQASLENLEPQN